MAHQRWSVWAGQAALVIVLLGSWELSVKAGWVSAVKFGQPSRVWFYFMEALSRGYLWAHLRVTLYEELVGFALGMVAGSAVGLGLWWSRRAARVLDPFVVMFNGIPKIALAPPMIIWFGIYETSKIVLAALVCFVVAWLTTYTGARLVDRDLLDMVRAVGGSQWQAFTRVVVPSTLPWILAAARINIGFGLVGAVVGEFVASNHGLGFLAAQAAMLFQISRLWMIVLVIVAVAGIQYCGVLAVERYLFRWAADERLRGVA